GDHGLEQHADLVRVGRHAGGEGEAAEGGVGDLEVDGEHVAAPGQIAHRLADGDEGLDVHDPGRLVEAEDVAQRPHADLVPAVLRLEAGRQVHPGAPVGAHRLALGGRLGGPAADLVLDLADLVAVALGGRPEHLVKAATGPQNRVKRHSD